MEILVETGVSFALFFLYVVVAIAVYKYEYALYPTKEERHKRAAAPTAALCLTPLFLSAFWIWWSLDTTNGGAHTNGQVVSWSLIFSCILTLGAIFYAFAVAIAVDDYSSDMTGWRCILWPLMTPFAVLAWVFKGAAIGVHDGLYYGLVKPWDSLSTRLADIPLKGQLREAELERKRVEVAASIAEKEAEAGINV